MLKKYEWLWHGLFWALFVLLMTLIFARFLGFEQALLRNFATCLVLAPLVYINLYVLIERLLFKEKYFELKEIDSVRVKGKLMPCVIFEVYSHLGGDEIKNKEKKNIY